MPEVEYWTYGAFPTPGRLGFNFGAPGDRREKQGTLWWDYPPVGGPSPELGVTVLPEKVRYFRHHSSRIKKPGQGIKSGSAGKKEPSSKSGQAWIAASGVIGLRELITPLPVLGAPVGGSRRYTARLHFAEPEDLAPGDRVFAIRVEGVTVRDRFDPVAEAGGRNRSVVVEARGVRAGDRLRVTLTPAPNSRPPILCGLEVVVERP
jgi:hypothetical protein